MNPQLIQNAVKVVVTATVAAAVKYGPKIIMTIGEVMKRKKN
jgi:hypothetical protein